MNNNALVSILIPCYNHEAFLNDCLTSILKQTYHNIELLICDDCSPDNSYQIIRSFEPALQERFQRVEILHNEVNCGVTQNINRMLSIAKGEYIKILASDDAMASTAIEKLAGHLDNNPDCAVVICNGLRVPEEQHYPDFSSASKVYDEEPDFSEKGFFERVARCNRIFAPGAMVRSRIYDAYGLYDETIPVEDLEYWLRLLKTGDVTFGYVPEDLVYYRINGSSMSSVTNTPGLENRRRRMHFAVLDTLQKHKDGFATGIYEEVAIGYILGERSFALNCGLKSWAKDLRGQIIRFPGKSALSGKEKLRLVWRTMKSDLKQLLI